MPDADDFDGLVDTDPKDQPVLASAIEARARYLVTANVRDFGEKDLAEHRMVAVHPGLFLAHHVAPEVYREVLEVIGEKRVREPRDPLSIHEQEISVHLPALFATHREIFGPATPDSSHQPPAVSFRGARCVRCYRALPDDLQPGSGLCAVCFG